MHYELIHCCLGDFDSSHSSNTRDWSDAVAEEEEQEEKRQGYYTDSVVQGGRPRRGLGRGGRARYTGNYRQPGTAMTKRFKVMR